MAYETLKKKDAQTYGSDSNGLIWGYRFAPGVPAERVNSETALEFLQDEETAVASGFVWLHFSLSNSATETWLHRNLSLPEDFYDSLKSHVGLTRLEQEEQSLVGVFHDVLYDFKFDASEISAATLCIQPKLVISARLRPIRSMERVRQEVREGKQFRSSVELLAVFLEEQACVLDDVLRQATSRVDRIEDQLLANRVTVSRSALGSLRRVLVRLQRQMAPEPAAMFRLLHRPPEWIASEDLTALRQAAEEFSASVGDASSLVERIKLLQEELTAQVNEQTSRTLFVLTLVTVLALPINLVAGLLGMNVGGIPFTDTSHGFFEIVLALLALTALLGYITVSHFRR